MRWEKHTALQGQLGHKFYLQKSSIESLIPLRFVNRRFRSLIVTSAVPRTTFEKSQLIIDISKVAREVCSWAAEEGFLNILRWARANGAPWGENTCAYAAGGGHLEVLQWARASGAPWDKESCLKTTHLKVKEWILKEGGE